LIEFVTRRRLGSIQIC